MITKLLVIACAAIVQYCIKTIYTFQKEKKSFFLTLYMLTFFHFKISLYNFNKSNNSGFVKKRRSKLFKYYDTIGLEQVK